MAALTNEEDETNLTDQLGKTEFDWNKVNRKTIKTRLLYFFYLGGASTLLPFLPVYFRHVGMSAYQVGLLTGIKPFLRFCSAPFWGSIADALSQHKLIFLVTLVLATAFNFSTWSLSQLQHSQCLSKPSENKTTFVFLSSNSKTGQKFDVLQLNGSPNRSLLSHVCLELSRRSFENISKEPSYIAVTSSKVIYRPIFLRNGSECKQNGRMIALRLQKIKAIMNTSLLATFKNTEQPMCLQSKEHRTTHCILEVNYYTELLGKSSQSPVEPSLSNGGKFWLLLFLSSSGEFFGGTISSLIDASVMHLLGDNKEKGYGHRRLFGAAGFGLMGLISGLAMDLGHRQGSADTADTVSAFSGFTTAFILYLALNTLTFIVACFFEIKQREKATGMFTHIKKIFTSAEILSFLLAVLQMGVCSGVITAFLFLFIKDLGSSNLLIGLSLTTNCTAEIFVFFISGWLLDIFGIPKMLYLTFAIYVVRLSGYVLITNPWFVLPLELLHGVTYAAMWTTSCSYAAELAPEGMGATMQGLVYGVHNGWAGDWGL